MFRLGIKIVVKWMNKWIGNIMKVMDLVVVGIK